MEFVEFGIYSISIFPRWSTHRILRSKSDQIQSERLCHDIEDDVAEHVRALICA